MNKIEIKNLYLIFGSEKQKALRMLKEGKSKNEILKTTDCTIAVKDANLDIHEGEFFVIMGLSGSGKSTLLRCINRLIKNCWICGATRFLWCFKTLACFLIAVC